ncbi:uncharacterized protein LOC143294079 [Babylonia areolata]|uniref:uncharacterized protein LOC143294079 n=1 Tax=Babylonia areolata TaxID=304850 RepID=UPI003FD1091B
MLTILHLHTGWQTGTQVNMASGRRLSRRLMFLGVLAAAGVYVFLQACVLTIVYEDGITRKLASQDTAHGRTAPQAAQPTMQETPTQTPWTRRGREESAREEDTGTRMTGTQKDHPAAKRDDDDARTGEAPQSKAGTESHKDALRVGAGTADSLQSGQQAAAARLLQVSRVCRDNGSQILGKVSKVYVYEARKVAYCSTHKVASTFWVRVFRWLYNDTRHGHVASPLLISKMDAHLLPLKTLKVRDLSKGLPQDVALVEASYRFLFTRDPYARLWSVYIDKFLLPDNYFWAYHYPRLKSAVYRKGAGVPASKQPVATSRVQGNQSPQPSNQTITTSTEDRQLFPSFVGARDAGSNVHGGSVPTKGSSCPDVTFRQFLLYVVTEAATGHVVDEHFRPVHHGCNPCFFRPHFIGHMETMAQDNAHVLGHMTLEHLVPELSANHVQQEIDMLIDFNFELVVKRRLQRQCVTDVDLERRLIKAFVYNGYIPADNESWLVKQLPLGKVKLRAAVLDLYHNSGRTSEDVKNQKDGFRIEAYRQIPRDLLLAVQKFFQWDFILFGYDPSPPELFEKT